MFQLWSHANLYEDKHKDNFVSTKYDNSVVGPKATLKIIGSKMHLRQREKGQEESALNSSANEGQLENGVIEEEEEEKPSMSVYMCIGLLVAVTVVSPWTIYLFFVTNQLLRTSSRSLR